MDNLDELTEQVRKEIAEMQKKQWRDFKETEHRLYAEVLAIKNGTYKVGAKDRKRMLR